MSKIIQWIMLHGVSILGIIQVGVKFVKELLTLCVNILFPIFPDDGTFEKAVLKIRSIVNIVDEWLEKIKGKML